MKTVLACAALGLGALTNGCGSSAPVENTASAVGKTCPNDAALISAVEEDVRSLDDVYVAIASIESGGIAEDDIGTIDSLALRARVDDAEAARADYRRLAAEKSALVNEVKSIASDQSKLRAAVLDLVPNPERRHYRSVDLDEGVVRSSRGDELVDVQSGLFEVDGKPRVIGTVPEDKLKAMRANVARARELKEKFLELEPRITKIACATSFHQKVTFRLRNSDQTRIPTFAVFRRDVIDGVSSYLFLSAKTSLCSATIKNEVTVECVLSSIVDYTALVGNGMGPSQEASKLPLDQNRTTLKLTPLSPIDPYTQWTAE